MATTTEEDRATTATNKDIAKVIANKGLASKGLYIVRSAGSRPYRFADTGSGLGYVAVVQTDRRRGCKKVRRGGDFGSARRRGRKYAILIIFSFFVAK